ncbi:MAG: hypothetical protein M1298_00830 [Chloroflexi bacterium]|nr:hypothetical protein [Chloroflexota bacterium]
MGKAHLESGIAHHMVTVILDAFGQILHAVVIGGLIGIRYLWPVWLIILGLWLLTRVLRGIFRWLGFPVQTPAKSLFPAISFRWRSTRSAQSHPKAAPRR